MSAEEQLNTRGKPKWLRRLVFALLALVAAVLIPVTISKMIGRYALRAQLQRLRDAGESLTFDEFQSRLPALADADNSALILDEIKGPWASPWENREKWREVPLLGDEKLPLWSEPWPIRIHESAKAFVDEHESLLARLDAIHNMPRGRHAINFAANPLEILLPSIGPLRPVAKLEVLAALRDATESNPDAALARCVTMVNISASLHDTPILIFALVSIFVESLAIDAAERVLSFGETSDEAVRSLQVSLEGNQQHEFFLNGMRGERLFHLAIADYADRHDMTQAMESVGIPRVAGVPTSSWLLSGVLELNTAKSLELQTDFINAADSPRSAIEAAKEHELAVRCLPAQYFVSKVLLGSYSRACELSAMHIAGVRCARVALAAERFRLDRSHWPAELAELVPEYIDAIPLDPFDGQPLRYKMDSDRVAIYSIGLNGVDDRGDVSERPRNGPPDVGFRLLNPELRGFKTIE